MSDDDKRYPEAGKHYVPAPGVHASREWVDVLFVTEGTSFGTVFTVIEKEFGKSESLKTYSTMCDKFEPVTDGSFFSYYEEGPRLTPGMKVHCGTGYNTTLELINRNVGKLGGSEYVTWLIRKTSNRGDDYISTAEEGYLLGLLKNG